MNLIKTGALLAGLTGLFVLVGGLIGGGTGAVIALVIALGMNFYAYWNSDTLALKAHGARPLVRNIAPDLYRITEVLAMNAGIPTPDLYIIENPQPNAFATGRSPEKSAVAVTTGLVNTLSRDEISGVIAHELAHIKNRDTLIMTIAASIGGAISMLAQFGFWFGGGRDRNPAAMVGALLAVFLAPLAAGLIQMTISRTREFSADRDGGTICGNPLWLANALRRLSSHHPEMASAERHPSTAHMFIVNPLSGHRFDSLFATHPPMERRIAELEAQAKEMRRTGTIGNVKLEPTSRSGPLVPPARKPAKAAPAIGAEEAPSRAPSRIPRVRSSSEPAEPEPMRPVSGSDGDGGPASTGESRIPIFRRNGPRK